MKLHFRLLTWYRVLQCCCEEWNSVFIPHVFVLGIVFLSRQLADFPERLPSAELPPGFEICRCEFSVGI